MPVTKSTPSAADSTFTRFADYAPTHLDCKGLGSDGQEDWLVFPMAHQPKISTLLDDSNWESLCAAMDESDPNGTDHKVHYFGHWTSDFEIVVVRPGSPAHAEAERLAAALADYPVLDEEDYSDREYEATLDNIKSELCRTTIVGADGAELNETADLACELFGWFSDNDQSAVESRDGHGGWPSSKQIEEGLLGLGYTCDDEGGPWIAPTVE